LKSISLGLFLLELYIMNKEVTIYDIAKALEISPATVSRALNNNSAVNENTKQRILETAKSLGYRSNLFASNLRRQKTNTIGVIVPILNSSFQSSVIAGIEKIANEAGFNIIISQSMEQPEKEVANAQMMFKNRVDGLLVSLSHSTENITHFEPFFDKGIPVIFFDRVADHNQCTGVLIDNIQAAYRATQHLIEQGCKKVVHIGGNQKINLYANRLKGYKYALIDNNIPFDESCVIINPLNEKGGIEAAQQILKMEKRPDGIFAANDACAISCMKALMKAGISIPNDIAFVGFNNDPITRVIEPNLTSVDYPGYEMGEVAVRNLINHLDGISDISSTNTITLRSDLIIRESSLKRELLLPVV
jgi:LacI family transcriptional regulator